MCKTWDAILHVKMHGKCLKYISSMLDFDLSCFHSICGGILSRLLFRPKNHCSCKIPKKKRPGKICGRPFSRFLGIFQAYPGRPARILSFGPAL